MSATNDGGPATGAKHDSGKVRAALPIQDFPRALVAVAWVSTFGAAKYAAHSWTRPSMPPIHGRWSRVPASVTRMHCTATSWPKLPAK